MNDQDAARELIRRTPAALTESLEILDRQLRQGQFATARASVRELHSMVRVLGKAAYVALGEK